MTQVKELTVVESNNDVGISFAASSVSSAVVVVGQSRITQNSAAVRTQMRSAVKAAQDSGAVTQREHRAYPIWPSSGGCEGQACCQSARPTGEREEHEHQEESPELD